MTPFNIKPYDELYEYVESLAAKHDVVKRYDEMVASEQDALGKYESFEQFLPIFRSEVTEKCSPPRIGALINLLYQLADAKCVFETEETSPFSSSLLTLNSEFTRAVVRDSYISKTQNNWFRRSRKIKPDNVENYLQLHAFYLAHPRLVAGVDLPLRRKMFLCTAVSSLPNLPFLCFSTGATNNYYMEQYCDISNASRKYTRDAMEYSKPELLEEGECEGGWFLAATPTIENINGFTHERMHIKEPRGTVDLSSIGLYPHLVTLSGMSSKNTQETYEYDLLQESKLLSWNRIDFVPIMNSPVLNSINAGKKFNYDISHNVIEEAIAQGTVGDIFVGALDNIALGDKEITDDYAVFPALRYERARWRAYRLNPSVCGEVWTYGRQLVVIIEPITDMMPVETRLGIIPLCGFSWTLACGIKKDKITTYFTDEWEKTASTGTLASATDRLLEKIQRDFTNGIDGSLEKRHFSRRFLQTG